MDLFTYMDDDIYQFTISHPKDNVFKDYLGFLRETGEINEAENFLVDGIAKEFLNVLETTNMTKVYKMPVLMAFYNNGNMRLDVTDAQLLDAWKAFFDQNGNWKDLDKNMSYEKYKSISDKAHLKKILTMPVHFLQESGKGFFVQRDGFAISLKSELERYIGNPTFVEQVKDIVEYRVMDYYRRRYRENGKKFNR